MDGILSLIQNFATQENIGWCICVLAVLYIFNRLDKKLVKSVNDNTKAISNLIKNHSDVMSYINTTKYEISRGFERIFDMVDDGLKKDRITHFISLYAGVAHEGLVLWFEDRIQQNHIQTNKSLVKQRYTDKFKNFVKGWENELTIYSYRGVKLSRINYNRTLEVMYADIFSSLWNAHLAMASGQDSIFSVDGEYSRKAVMDYLNGFRNQLESVVRNWCDNTSEHIIPSLPKRDVLEYEWMTDDFADEVSTDPSSPFYMAHELSKVESQS